MTETASDGAPLGVLLTGGTSRRMGRTKALLEVDGVRMADHTSAALSLVCHRLVEVGPGYTDLPAVSEDPPGQGPLVALVTGWKAAGNPTDAAIVLAVDLPFVTASLLRLLHDHPSTDSVVPVHNGRAQPLCALFSANALRTAAALVDEGRRAMRDLLEHVPYVELGEQEWSLNTPNALDDVDTPDDLGRAEARARSRM